MGSILKFLYKKTILVTGAAGFLSKMLIEKILRTQPDVKKIYLLLRAADRESANMRLQNEIIGKDLFKVLKEKMGPDFDTFMAEKVVTVPGDITLVDLGIKDFTLKQQIQNDLEVIVNSAATTNFYERYDVSLNINCFGVKHVVDFAMKCTKLKMLVHVSTAYVHGERKGLITESPFSIGDTLNGKGGLNIEEEKRLVEKKLSQLHSENATDHVVKSAMKEMGIERANTYGWPNVYSFTKALGEMLVLKHKKNLPVIIIRPTIITSTLKEPFPGWIEGIRTIDTFAVAYGKGRLAFLLAHPDNIIDAIPGDMVVNAIIVAMAVHTNQSEAKIYQVGSSASNPVKLSLIVEKVYEYFSEHPWMNQYGKPVSVRRMKFYTSWTSFHRYITLRYILPLKCLQAVNAALCQCFTGLCSNMNKTINFVRRLFDIYRTYLFFNGTFDDSNTEKLRHEGFMETNIFFFDSKIINWEDYFMNTHFPGLVKYAF